MTDLKSRLKVAAEGGPSEVTTSEPLVSAVREQTERMVDIAMYQENMRVANSEQEGRASLARFIFSGSTPILAIAAGGAYVAHGGTPIGLIIAKIMCFVGALFAFMCLMSGNDRWQYQQIALSNAVQFEKRGIGDGIATSMRDLYEAPGLLPGRVEAAGVAAVTFWLAVYIALIWVY